MPETISVDFPDISGDLSVYTAFIRSFDGTLLNTGGDAISEIATGIWALTLAEERVANAHYFFRIYSGTAELDRNLVYADILYAGQTLVAFDGQLSNLTVPWGIVGSGATTVTFTPQSLTPAGSTLNQFQGRIITFDNDTPTAGLRGQSTEILGCSAGALPLFSVTALTVAPASGDIFRIT